MTVTPLRAADPPENYTTSYDHTLEETEPPPASPTAPDLKRRPILPDGVRHKAVLKTNVGKATGRATYAAGYHGVRLPWYCALGAVWAPVGVGRIVSRQYVWWKVPKLMAAAELALADDKSLGLRLHKEAMATRSRRGKLLAAEAGGILAGLGVLVFVAPPLLALAVLAGGTGWLAHVGASGRPIVKHAIIKPRLRKLNLDIVQRAYYAAGLGHPDPKKNQPIEFGSQMRKDGDGSHVIVDLPYGKGLDDAIAARPKIASGLDVALSQVFITRDPSSHRRHVLWIADRDPLAVPAGPSPLLACKPMDIWQPVPFGLDERGNRVAVDLMWNSVLIGAQPRQGKTFSARALALAAALDPYVRIDVFDGKASPDWRKFALVAERAAFGVAPTRDGDPIELLLDTLTEAKRDAEDRYHRLSKMKTSICPDGKLTRDIARNRSHRMPVRLIILEEFQEFFVSPYPDASREIAALLVYLVKVAPAAGIILLSSTQKPGGIGSGIIAEQFKAYRDNHTIRFSLRTGSYQNSDLVLGAGAYGEGFDSSALLPSYKGVGILRGASDATPTVRTYLADGQDAERILTAARGYRERAGTLAGMALGEDVTRQSRDVLADVVSVFDGEPGMHWRELAARLAERLPETYADTTAETVSAQLRSLGVPSQDVKRSGSAAKGCRLTAVRQALDGRALAATG